MNRPAQTHAWVESSDLRAQPVSRRALVFRWIVAGVGAILLPKCVLCLAAYLGLVAGLGVVGQELCGASASAVDATGFIGYDRFHESARWFVAMGLVAAVLIWLVAVRRRRAAGAALQAERIVRFFNP